MTKPNENLIFERREEPREGAFTIAVPQGWLMEGGIIRADFNRQQVDAQNMTARLDLSIKKDARGTVMLRFVPEFKFCDMRMNASGMYGFFPPGSNYQGMLVTPLLPAPQFLLQMMFPWAHPQAVNAHPIQAEASRGLVEEFLMTRKALGQQVIFNYDGGIATYQYDEKGITYTEKAFVVLEIGGQAAGGMWSNTVNYYYRAPSAEFDQWEPVLIHMHRSSKTNYEWLGREWAMQEFLAGQFRNAQMAEQARAQRALEVQRYLQGQAAEMVEHRRRINAEIRNDNYLMLTNQEEYLNPYTHEIDTGSNEWQYRWVSGSGDEFYSDREDADPNQAEILRRSDWKRTPIRPRYPDGPPKE